MSIMAMDMDTSIEMVKRQGGICIDTSTTQRLHSKTTITPPIFAKFYMILHWLFTSLIESMR